MAFLQETPRSLRAYLILVGVLGTGAQLAGALSAEAGPIGRLVSLIGIAITVGYAWLGFAFKSLISSAPRRIEQVLIAGAVYSIAVAVLVVVVYPSSEAAGGALVRAAGGLLITLYLLKNVKRLAREAQALIPLPSSSSAA